MTGMERPPDLFDRQWEWDQLARFAEDRATTPSLGIVTGRRRQGKSVLVRALCAATGGFYWEAFEGGRSDQLADLATHLGRFTRSIAPLALPDWDAALAALGSLRTPVAIDELPYLLRDNPEIPSLLQRRLGADRSGVTRWILCGSALRVMGGLLGHEAPLRGRAGLELVVPPFDYRTARQFWGIADPTLALQVFAVTGGTPAYAREFVRGDAPRDAADFDAWVCRTALDPSTPLFREGRVLLAEEDALSDRGLYHAVLAAIAAGENAPSRIAGRLGRPATSMAHPLSVLVDTALVARHDDAFHPRRPTYEIAEPIVRFHHAILRPSWSVLERPGRQADVWAASRDTFHARVLGPIFEEVCRTWTLRFAPASWGRIAAVQRGVVNDTALRTQHEVDVVARDADGTIVALGEAKWGRGADPDRLRRIQALLVAQGQPAADARLVRFGGRSGPDVVDLPTLYGD
jgi:AAA+ ATPase superfamily predicted ATPase